MLPITSLQAKQAAKQLAITHRQQILNALKKIGKGTFEDIATKAQLTPHQVARRTKELEGDTLKGLPALIEKLDQKKPTPTGRMAYVYQIKK